MTAPTPPVPGSEGGSSQDYGHTAYPPENPTGEAPASEEPTYIPTYAEDIPEEEAPAADSSNPQSTWGATEDEKIAYAEANKEAPAEKEAAPAEEAPAEEAPAAEEAEAPAEEAPADPLAGTEGGSSQDYGHTAYPS